MVDELALMCGIDIPILEIKTTIHQPSIKEISYLGEKDFFASLQIILISKEFFSQDKTFLESTTNFQIFMMIVMNKEKKEQKKQILSFFDIIFPQYKVVFTPSSIIFSKGEKNFLIDENNFEILQEYLRIIFCIKDSSEAFNPKNKKAKEIAEKLMRGRKRVAEQKGTKKNSIFSQYLSVIAVGLKSLSLKEAMELTVYQLYDLIERYQLYISWDIDIRSRLAGAKADAPLENWMKNIHE